MDFSADVLVKVLKDIPEVTTWKIEGRKKSPHYVYYTTKAYRLLRDDPKRRKEALSYLDYAMGRDFSHYNLLTQRVFNPLEHDSETGSGLFLGRVKNPFEPYINTREELFTGDLLRIGYEDDKFHDIQKVTRSIPKKGKFFLSKKAKGRVKKGAPVFIIDRRGKELYSLIRELETQLNDLDPVTIRPAKEGGTQQVSHQGHRISRTRNRKAQLPYDMDIFRGRPQPNKGQKDTGMWISAGAYGIKPAGKTWLWLDPLLFPEEEVLCHRYVASAVKKGAKNFVLNASWQIDMFKDPGKLNIWAGPFCNITNTRTIEFLKSQGFSGAIVSPELDKENFIALPQTSSLPLGMVIRGNWPLAVSRIISPDLTIGQPFFSPKGEAAWTNKSNNTYYTFPNWLLDLSDKQDELIQAGYAMFVTLNERSPKGMKMKSRPGLWNWNLKLL